jgi:hypothetical protein
MAPNDNAWVALFRGWIARGRHRRTETSAEVRPRVPSDHDETTEKVGDQMTAPGVDPTGIEVRTRIFPLAFILLLFKTNVIIDGVPFTQSWGTQFYSVAPGRHEVRVSFRYILSRTMGENTIVVDVAPGQTTKIQYRSPILVFLRGPIKIVS